MNKKRAGTKRQRVGMSIDEDINVNELIATNCRLTNEILATKSLFNEKDQKLIGAYESLYKLKVDNQQKQKLIEQQNRQIAELSVEIKRAKIQAFGCDLMSFGRLCQLCIHSNSLIIFLFICI